MKSMHRCLMAIFLSGILASGVQADFSGIDVRMQSGETVALTALPWFQLARGLESNAYRQQAPFYEWSIHAPPAMCPFHYWWQVRTKDSIAAHLNAGQERCDRMMNEKLSHLPEPVRQVCTCRLLLRSQVIQKVGQKALWTSHADEQLLSDELRIARTLRHDTEAIPILLSIGGQQVGLYDYSGNQLCRPLPHQATDDVAQSGRKTLMKILETRIKVRVICFDQWEGVLDSSGMSYNWLTQKTTGDVILQLDSGEKYVVAN